MGVAEGSISFSNQNVQTNSTEFSGDREWRRLKFEAGKSYRIKFIDSNVEMRHRHYQPLDNGKRGYYRCLGHTGYCPVCQAASDGFGGEGKNKLKKAQEMFGANILVYTTDNNGNPIQPLNAEVYFWNFNAKKFVEIRSIQQEWGDITKLDLKLTCADDQAAQFQNVSITNCAQCLYESDPNFKAQCDQKIAKDKYPLAKMICKEVDLMTMIQVFGLPQKYIPQDMLSQMPQGQQTVTDYANGVPAPQGTPVQTQFAQAPQYVAPTPAPQAPVYQQPVAPQPAPAVVQPVVQEVAPQPQPAQVQPVVQEVAPQPQYQQVQAPSDAYADLNALQDILG